MDATMERPAEAVVDVAEVHNGAPMVKYSATEAALADLRARFAGARFDLATTAGNQAARAARLELVTLRAALEKRRKEFKAPALAFGQMIDSEAKRITVEILAIEGPIDEQIKADEKRRADEKAAREKAEAERKAKLQAGVDGLRAFITQAQAPGMTASRLASGIKVLEGMEFPADQWQEFHAHVIQAHAEALEYLRTAHAGAVERETEAARLAAERAELERQRAVIRAEQERIEADRRAAELARAQAERAAAAQREAIVAAERARVEAEEASERQRLAAEHARLEAERLAEMTADAPKPEDDDPTEGRPYTGAAPGMLQDDCRGLSQALDGTPDAMVHARDAVADILAQQDEPATLKGGDIAARLGFVLQADFIARELGLPWRATNKSAKLWRESDWPHIKAALVKHIGGLA